MDRLDQVIASNIIAGRSRMTPIDAFGEIQIRHFVHLMEAAHHQVSLAILAASVVQLIRGTPIDLTDYGGLFCPKLGNVLLAKTVADSLGLMSGFVRQSVLMDRFVETRAIPGCKVVLIDDVSSEGRLLSECIRDASEDGFTVDAVFTVVDRQEGDAAELLRREHGITLRSCRTLNDEHLDVLMQEFRDIR